MHEISVTKRTVLMEDSSSLTLQYAALAEELPDGLIHYGVKLTVEETGDAASAADLTTSAPKINAFIELLARCAVTPVSFMDVLSDWL